MKAPQFRELRLCDLKDAAYNPPHRTEPRRVRDLTDSISKTGLIYPILVSPPGASGKYTIIDGHRRAAAAREIGQETIAAVVSEGDPNDTYATVNATSRRMGGNDALSVWLKEPNAVTPLLRTRFAHMNDVLGIKRVSRICKEGYSLKLFNSAMQVVRYCDVEDEEGFVTDVVDWLLEHRQTSIVKQAMAAGQSPKTMLSAVRANKPLTMKLSVKD